MVGFAARYVSRTDPIATAKISVWLEFLLGCFSIDALGRIPLTIKVFLVPVHVVLRQWMEALAEVPHLTKLVRCRGSHVLHFLLDNDGLGEWALFPSFMMN